MVKCWKGVSLDHFIVVCKIVHKLVNQGFEVYTEVVFNDLNRADICAISPEGKGFIIEVLKSEPEGSYDEKLNKYNLLWEMIKVDCESFSLEEFEI
ncbi:MAG: hypothetical protein ABIH82_06455 [Candidatus Woesearchaeota archaeon]